jgi:hypothetical protein
MVVQEQSEADCGNEPEKQANREAEVAMRDIDRRAESWSVGGDGESVVMWSRRFDRAWGYFGLPSSTVGAVFNNNRTSRCLRLSVLLL